MTNPNTGHELSTASRASRAQKKKQGRSQQKEIIQRLDALLPARAVHPAPAKSVGHRALGPSGRCMYVCVYVCVCVWAFGA